MRWIVFTTGLVIFTKTLAWADEAKHQPFYGTWGTHQQCARTAIVDGGSVMHEPFEIGPVWLKQGKLWCQLNWGPLDGQNGRYFTAAHAQCGEDSVRGYFLRMQLVEGQLQLRWEFPISNGPLQRCAPS